MNLSYPYFLVIRMLANTTDYSYESEVYTMLKQAYANSMVMEWDNHTNPSYTTLIEKYLTDCKPVVILNYAPDLDEKVGIILLKRLLTKQKLIIFYNSEISLINMLKGVGFTCYHYQQPAEIIDQLATLKSN